MSTRPMSQQKWRLPRQKFVVSLSLFRTSSPGHRDPPSTPAITKRLHLMNYTWICFVDQHDTIWRRLSRVIGQELHDIQIKVTRPVKCDRLDNGGVAKFRGGRNLGKWFQSRGKSVRVWGHTSVPCQGRLYIGSKSELQYNIRRTSTVSKSIVYYILTHLFIAGLVRLF